MQSTVVNTMAACVLVWGVLGSSVALAAFAENAQDPFEPVRVEEVTESTLVAGWGQPMPSAQLAMQRGGFDVVSNDMALSSSVAHNSATNVQSGDNTITQGSFSNASGFPMVIQNSGSNVSIQNATIVNLQLN